MSIPPVLDAMDVWFYFQEQNRPKFETIMKDLDWNGYLLTHVWIERFEKFLNLETEMEFQAIQDLYTQLECLILPLKPIFMPGAIHVVPFRFFVKEAALKIDDTCEELWKRMYSLMSSLLREMRSNSSESMRMLPDIALRIDEWHTNQFCPMIWDAKSLLHDIELARYGGMYDSSAVVVNEEEEESEVDEEIMTDESVVGEEISIDDEFGADEETITDDEC